MYTPKKDGVTYDAKLGRLMEHSHYATRIFWSKSMLDYLRTNFPTTLNLELAECLGVSQSTMIRKARQLGLQKDPAWLKEIWETRRRMAHSAARRKGYPGRFPKGVRQSPENEFKPGHQLSPEVDERRRQSLRKWHRTHPGAARERMLKAWAKRRKEAANADS